MIFCLVSWMLFRGQRQGVSAPPQTYAFLSDRGAGLVSQVVWKQMPLGCSSAPGGEVSVVEGGMQLWARADGGQDREMSSWMQRTA